MAGATVGGAFLSASLQVLFDRLASREVLSFIRGQKLISDALLKKLERKLVIVHAVLNDAEVKQFINSSVKKWLYLLKEAVYDAEDIFDEVATEAQRCKMEAAGYQTSTSQVGYILFTWFHAPFDNQSIEPRVEEIIDRLEDIAHDRDALGLKEGVGEKPSQRWPSTSLVDESLVYGRDGEKQKIIELLLSDDARSDEIGVISIVGMCGAGKTTLAQLLYNDQTVKEHFDLKAWVWVSEEFDPIKVTKTILEAIQEFDPNSQEAITNDLNLLQLQLKESINMKKFLLILDDVWNEDSNNWDKLRTPLIVGSKGSKIVVTTRSTNVAIAMRAFHTHCLGGLSFEDSWLLFKKLVFETEDSSIHPQLEAIGKIIVVKCQGLPLAIKALGSFLRSKTEAREWDDILKSKMCQWSSNELLPTLTLSYYHLPSQLKRCFAYCSIFPKDYEFNKEKLILLWMAEGLLQEDFSKQMEEVGDMYFHELLSKSFFQQSLSNESCFVMHDLIREFAQLVSNEFSICLDDGEVYKVSEKTRHLSYCSSAYDTFERFETLSEIKYLRTFLPLRGRTLPLYHLSKRVVHDLLLESRCLRVLCLHDYQIFYLPPSISKLRHLRYMDLSNTRIKRLPDSICTLYNLQTLILSSCRDLNELPSKLGKLINLRYLDISGIYLKEMPSDIGNFRSLRTLTDFIVGRKNGSRIGELRKLSDIQGRLKISKLHNVESGGDAMEANLKDKRYLDELVLAWDKDKETDDVRQKVVAWDKKTDDVTQKGAPWDKKTEDVIQKGDILDNFQPHRNLKRLYISSFGGSRFSDWIGNPSFFSLVSLELFHCEHCSSLPPLGRLPSLKHLHVQGMTGIEKVGSEFYGNTSSSVTVNPFFPSLCTLRFKFMWNWEKWLCCGGRRGEFPRLQELYIINCPKLIGKLSKQLRSLKKLEITNCPQLLGASIRVPAIHELMMVNCGKLQLKRPACGFTCLEILEISDISQWKQLPSGLKKLSIKECDSTETLLEGTLQSNTCLLQHLVIRNSSFSRSLLMVGLPSTLKSLKIYNSTKLEFLLPELLRCHHPFLEYIWIEGSTCDSPSLSLSLSIFPRLTNLRMEDLEGLEYLSILISKGDPTSLSCLTVTACPGLVSIELPALNLASYWISHCSELKFLKHNLSSLQRLSLEACPELLFERESLPLDLRELEISNCNKLTPRVDWGLQRVASLTHFTIRNGCEDMELFPGECLLPSTLTSLEIEHLPNLKSLESKGLQQLTSLTKLSILNCPKFQSFGEVGLQHLTSLRHIQISYCPVLKSLTDVGLQHLISLEELWVIDCPKLQYLAKERLSNSLSCLTIKECPLLEHRCQFGKGQYWHYIAHIPHIIINDVLY